jgi:hypothetical protein
MRLLPPAVSQFSTGPKTTLLDEEFAQRASLAIPSWCLPPIKSEPIMEARFIATTLLHLEARPRSRAFFLFVVFMLDSRHEL